MFIGHVFGHLPERVFDSTITCEIGHQDAGALRILVLVAVVDAFRHDVANRACVGRTVGRDAAGNDVPVGYHPDKAIVLAAR